MDSQVIREILEDYVRASRQLINFEKSVISFSENVLEDMRVLVEGIVSVSREVFQDIILFCNR